MKNKRISAFRASRCIVVFSFGILLLWSSSIKASSRFDNFTANKELIETVAKQVKDTVPEGVLYMAEQMPSFPGGESAMNKYMSENVKYPVKAQEAGIQGRVTVRFVVRETGMISDVEVIRGFDPECDAEAVRVIKSMPKWNPGEQNGQGVPVYITVPIVFRLRDNNAERNETVVIVYKDQIVDGNNLGEILAADFRDRNISDMDKIQMVNIPLSEEEAVAKFGEAVKGKNVIVIDFEVEPRDDISSVGERMPRFPGGEMFMNKYITTNLKYPEKALKAKIEGRVTIRFIVKKTGDIEDIKVVRGIDPECDAEAIRVIKTMPKWEPGIQNGEPVDAYFTLPIVFNSGAKPEGK